MIIINIMVNLITLDYFTLESEDSNSTVSIDLEDDKHINLPKIVEGLIYIYYK